MKNVDLRTQPTFKNFLASNSIKIKEKTLIWIELKQSG